VGGFTRKRTLPGSQRNYKERLRKSESLSGRENLSRRSPFGYGKFRFASSYEIPPGGVSLEEGREGGGFLAQGSHSDAI